MYLVTKACLHVVKISKYYLATFQTFDFSEKPVLVVQKTGVLFCRHIRFIFHLYRIKTKK